LLSIRFGYSLGGTSDYKEATATLAHTVRRNLSARTRLRISLLIQQKAKKLKTAQ